MSSSNCCFLTCILVSQEAGQMVWYSHLFQNFPQFIVIHTVKGFGTVNKAEIDVFLELSCFFDDPADVGSLISGSSAFSKTSLNIWQFTVHVLLNSGLESLAVKALQTVLLKWEYLKVKITFHKLQDGSVLAGIKIALVLLYTSVRVLGWSSVLSMFWKEYIFFWAVGLKIVLHIFSKPCYKQCMFCHLDFVVPFYRHRQNRFPRILRDIRIFRIANEHWFQLQVPSCISPQQNSQLSFEDLKPGIKFSSLFVKVLDGIFFQ